MTLGLRRAVFHIAAAQRAGARGQVFTGPAGGEPRLIGPFLRPQVFGQGVDPLLVQCGKRLGSGHFRQQAAGTWALALGAHAMVKAATQQAGRPRVISSPLTVKSLNAALATGLASKPLWA